MVAADLNDESCQRLLLDDHPVVTYSVFEKAYWPRLSKDVTKGLGRVEFGFDSIRIKQKCVAPWTVFSEFMGLYCAITTTRALNRMVGVIKGSEMALKCPGGFLDEQSYTDLSARAYPIFADQRKILYNAFDSYCKLKRGHDMADRFVSISLEVLVGLIPVGRTYAILKALLSGVLLRGQRVDYM